MELDTIFQLTTATTMTPSLEIGLDDLQRILPVDVDVSTATPTPTRSTTRYICADCSATFSRKADRDRHASSLHGAGPRFYCRIQGCHFGIQGFPRRDKLMDHMRQGHRDTVLVNGVWTKKEHK
jgi:hypothetical protein